MEKSLIIKINSRKNNSQKYENKIISALESIGFKYDGADTDFVDEFNRNLFFFISKDTDIEVFEIDLDDE